MSSPCIHRTSTFCSIFNAAAFLVSLRSPSRFASKPKTGAVNHPIIIVGIVLRHLLSPPHALLPSAPCAMPRSRNEIYFATIS